MVASDALVVYDFAGHRYVKFIVRTEYVYYSYKICSTF